MSQIGQLVQLVCLNNFTLDSFYVCRVTNIAELI